MDNLVNQIGFDQLAFQLKDIAEKLNQLNEILKEINENRKGE